MASFKLGEAFVDLRLDDRRYNAQLAAARKALNSVGSGVSAGLRAPMMAIGAMLASHKAQLTALGGAFAGAFTFHEVVSQAREAESQMARLQMVTGGTKDEMAAMGSAFNRIAANMTGVKLGDVFKIGEIGARLGIGQADLELFTRDISRISAVMKDVPVEELSNRFASLLTVFNRGPHEVQNMASALQKLDMMSTATARDILDISSRMGGAASFLGMTPEKTLALATAMRQARVEIETAGTAMSQIMLRMTDPKSSGGFARMAGMTGEAFKKLRKEDPSEAIQRVVKGLEGMEKGRAIQMLNSVGLDGQRVRGVLLKMIPVLDEWKTYTKAAEDEWRGMTAILAAFGIQGKTADGILTQMWNNIELTARALGQHLLPLVKGFAKGVMDLSVDVRGYLEDNGGAFENWGKSVGRSISYIGLLWKQWPLMMLYAEEVFKEKMAQMPIIMKRVGKLLQNGCIGMLAIIGDTLDQVASMIGAKLQNLFADIVNDIVVNNPALAKLLGMGLIAPMKVPDVKPNFAPLDQANLWQGLPNGLMGKLPNRNAKKKALVDAMEAKRKEQEAARAAMLQDDESRAENARGAAAFRDDVAKGRGPQAFGPGGKFPRGQFGGGARNVNEANADARVRIIVQNRINAEWADRRRQAALALGAFGTEGLLGGAAGMFGAKAAAGGGVAGPRGKAAVAAEKRAKAARVAAMRADRRKVGGKLKPNVGFGDLGLPVGVPKPVEPIDEAARVGKEQLDQQKIMVAVLNKIEKGIKGPLGGGIVLA